MTGFLRRAGEGMVGPARIRWSVAEGTRGRRWRWTIDQDGQLLSTTLLELDGAGRLVRLEHETAAGLLTLHPEPDGRSVHGNRVRAGGVDPIALAWSAGAGVVFVDDAFGSALAAGLERSLIVGADGSVEVREAGSALDAAALDAAALDAAALEVDARGVPRLADASEWALEV
jgi:hypothetical protein